LGFLISESKISKKNLPPKQKILFEKFSEISYD